MNVAVIWFGVLVGVVVFAAKYDTLDVDAILSNDRVLNSYIKCMLEQGPCTPEGRDLRESAPEALKTSCKECTSAQKALLRKASTFMIKNRPKEWALIVAKYDPDNIYQDGFNAFLNTSD